MLVEIESIHGPIPPSLSEPVMVFYRVTDDEGIVHSYGPLKSHDPAFDPNAIMEYLPKKIERAKVEQTANEQKAAITKAALDAVQPQLDAIDEATKESADVKPVIDEVIP